MTATTMKTTARRGRPTPAADDAGPMTNDQAATYQRLRAHLAFLRLGAAGEALTAVLDAARRQDLTVIDTMERLLAVEVRSHRSPPVGRAAAVRLPAP